MQTVSLREWARFVCHHRRAVPACRHGFGEDSAACRTCVAVAPWCERWSKQPATQPMQGADAVPGGARRMRCRWAALVPVLALFNEGNCGGFLTKEAYIMVT